MNDLKATDSMIEAACRAAEEEGTHLWRDTARAIVEAVLAEVPREPAADHRARLAAETEVFNPAYRVARCGQQSAHGPHVVEHGPDQPRNCPGTGGQP